MRGCESRGIRLKRCWWEHDVGDSSIGDVVGSHLTAQHVQLSTTIMSSPNSPRSDISPEPFRMLSLPRSRFMLRHIDI